MSATNAPTERLRLGEVLVAAGVVTEDQLGDALAAQAMAPRKTRLGQQLIVMDACSETDIADALSEQLGLPSVDLDQHPPPRPDVVELVPRHLADRHDLLPLRFDRRGGKLTIAISDPTNVVAGDDLRTIEGINSIEMLVAVQSPLRRAQIRAYERGVASRAMAELGSIMVDDEPDADAGAGASATDEPVIRLVNALLADAIRTRTSDVHVEPQRQGMRVRYRIDGMLREVQQIPRKLAPAVTSRLKIMSGMDIAERRRPQDGRAAIRVDGHEVDLRVSTMPAMYGETTVLRLLRKGASRLTIDDLGFDDEQRRAYEAAIGRSQGMILMTGPTGSGKTTTLYAGLAELARPETNVVTLEDPIEYQLDGVNQSQMQPKIGMTFAAGLRTVLRQDPDVIMVGEIRDSETADLAVDASFTGHLVLSTLHTNDAPSTVARLAELGVERFLLSTTLLLVVAQRLARRVCSDCAEAYVPHPATMEQLNLSAQDLIGSSLMRGPGCASCDMTGYRGRVGLYEFLTMTRRLRQLISDGGTELQIGALARAEGMQSLRQAGIAKALEGLVTLEEVLRVTPEDQFRADHDHLDDLLMGAQLAPPPAPPAPLGADTSAEEAPVSAIDAAAAKARLERQRAVRTAKRVGAIETHRLLVIGDALLVEEATRALPEGWVLLTEGTADEGLLAVALSAPDVVLLQGDLHGSPTIEALRELREVEDDHRPVLLRTERPLESSLLAAAMVLGITDHVDGEVPVDSLRARLVAALPHH